MKSKIEKMNSVLDEMEEEHFKNIDRLSQELTTENLSLITRDIPFIVSSYTKLYSKAMLLIVEAEKLLEELYREVYYDIKTSAHQLSVLNLSSHTELNKFVQLDEHYIELSKLIEYLTKRVKLLESNIKTISDYSFHYRNRLEWRKFLEGESK
jgi:hypothetical protein